MFPVCTICVFLKLNLNKEFRKATLRKSSWRKITLMYLEEEGDKQI